MALLKNLSIAGKAKRATCRHTTSITSYHGMRIMHVSKFLVESELEPAQERSDKSDKNMPGKKQRERLARKQGLNLQRVRKYSISMVRICFN